MPRGATPSQARRRLRAGPAARPGDSDSGLRHPLRESGSESPTGGRPGDGGQPPHAYSVRVTEVGSRAPGPATCGPTGPDSNGSTGGVGAPMTHPHQPTLFPFARFCAQKRAKSGALLRGEAWEGRGAGRRGASRRGPALAAAGRANRLCSVRPCSVSIPSPAFIKSPLHFGRSCRAARAGPLIPHAPKAGNAIFNHRNLVLYPPPPQPPPSSSNPPPPLPPARRRSHRTGAAPPPPPPPAAAQK